MTPTILVEGVKFYHKQFTYEEVSQDSPILNHIPELIREEDNMLLAEQPNMEENTEGYVISRVIHDRLDRLLTRVIYPNQSGFVKGRNIIENVLLTQEIVTDIRKRGKLANVVIKLDMTKAYDRVSWLYLCKVMKKMGFSGNFIDLIWRLLANNWYSVLLNGHAHGFFHYTRRFRQGDPLSHTLFIIATEVLSRALNSLFDQPGFVEAVTGFMRGKFPFTYLGVPVTHARKRKVDYIELLKKFKDKLQTWKGKLLSYGGKAVLITSVLQRGLGFRSIYDMSKSLCAKLWWKFRTSSSLWANFMWNKYCKKQIPQNETINHLFLYGDFAIKVWRVFNAGAGLSMNCIQVKHAIRSWWEAKCHYKLKMIYKAVAAFIVWQI
ncbi:uncharacterized protein LOC132063737 [Lycium ferocissimum]|uniref:uncharacterized protein LOC132063737 n=1 Tax=Lycium ferocissimum TaxID=112874 RepID=UPI002815D769|nr:uncharacterized protein LOC132063737 [Lycium ferocissimum]